MAILRTREITGQPMWLAQALAHIHNSAARIPNFEAEHNPPTAHLFIINPLSGAHLGSLFSTHPPVEERIARLRAMAQARSPWTMR
jgi:heat shock protein HtpX